MLTSCTSVLRESLNNYSHPTSPLYNVDILAQKLRLQGEEETKDHFSYVLTSYLSAFTFFSPSQYPTKMTAKCFFCFGYLLQK